MSGRVTGEHHLESAPEGRAGGVSPLSVISGRRLGASGCVWDRGLTPPARRESAISGRGRGRRASGGRQPPVRDQRSCTSDERVRLGLRQGADAPRSPRIRDQRSPSWDARASGGRQPPVCCRRSCTRDERVRLGLGQGADAPRSPRIRDQRSPTWDARRASGGRQPPVCCRRSCTWDERVSRRSDLGTSCFVAVRRRIGILLKACPGIVVGGLLCRLKRFFGESRRRAP